MEGHVLLYWLPLRFVDTVYCVRRVSSPTHARDIANDFGLTAAGLLALAVVVADAAMLDAAIGLDVRHEGGVDDGDSGAGARGWDGAGTPRHWEIEGRGGHFWYEQAGRR